MDALQDESLLATLTAGTHVYKHDFSREKRARKLLQLSSDGSSLPWNNVTTPPPTVPSALQLNLAGPEPQI